MTEENQNYRPVYKWLEDSKRNEAATELQAAVGRILKSHQLLSCFEAAVRFGVRIERPQDMPLTIWKDGQNLTVGRFFKRDGEETADPAIVLEIGKDKRWYPIHVELADDYRSCVGGPFSTDFEERQKQVRFAARWATDLPKQNYEAGEIADLWGENI